MMSTLEALLKNDVAAAAGKAICVFAYGSGSKSKVFGATIQKDWQEVVRGFDIEGRLDHREAIDYATYEQLHRGVLKKNVAEKDAGSFFLADVHEQRDETEGVRHYGYSAGLLLATT